MEIHHEINTMFLWLTSGFKIVKHWQDTPRGWGVIFKLTAEESMTFYHFINGMINMSPLKPFRSKVYSIKSQAVFLSLHHGWSRERGTQMLGTPHTVTRIYKGGNCVSMWTEWPHYGRCHDKTAKIGPHGSWSSIKEQPGNQAGQKTILFLRHTIGRRFFRHVTHSPVPWSAPSVWLPP